MVMAMANKRATVRVNVSAIDTTRATAKIRRKCRDEAPFTIPVIPSLLVLGIQNDKRDNYTEGQNGNNA